MVKFTIKRGKVVSESVKQHRLLHGRALDHTHIERGRMKRETFTDAERRSALERTRELGFLPKRFR